MYKVSRPEISETETRPETFETETRKMGIETSLETETKSQDSITGCQPCSFPANLGLFFVKLRVFLDLRVAFFGLVLIEICLFFGLVLYRFLFCGLLFFKFYGTFAVSMYC